MSAPIGVNRKPGQRRNERPAKCVHEYRLRKYLAQRPLESLKRSTIPFNAPLGTRHDPPLPCSGRTSSSKAVNGLWTQGCEAASKPPVPGVMEAMAIWNQ